MAFYCVFGRAIGVKTCENGPFKGWDRKTGVREAPKLKSEEKATNRVNRNIGLLKSVDRFRSTRTTSGSAVSS